MCGRIVIRATRHKFAGAFDAEVAADFTPRYNLAPTEVVPVVVQPAPGRRRILTTMRWGFKAAPPSPTLINARSETVARTPAFRDAFRHRRCLVAADAFYEWKRTGKLRQPFLIEMNDSSPFAFAGIWEDSKEMARCCILTTEANELIRTLHDRMPVILHPADYARWLDPTLTDGRPLQEILQPFPRDRMRLFPVSTAVNKAGTESAEFVKPIVLTAIQPVQTSAPAQSELF